MLDDVANTYGAGNAVGTVAYLPSGSKHKQEAFFALQQLTTNTAFLTTLADTVYNIPSTFDSLKAWDKKDDEHWAPLVKIFAEPGLVLQAAHPGRRRGRRDLGHRSSSSTRAARCPTCRRGWQPPPRRSTSSTRRRRADLTSTAATTAAADRRTRAARGAGRRRRDPSQARPWVTSRDDLAVRGRGCAVFVALPGRRDALLLVHQLPAGLLPAREVRRACDNYSALLTESDTFWVAVRNTLWMVADHGAAADRSGRCSRRGSISSVKSGAGVYRTSSSSRRSCRWSARRWRSS